MVCNQYFTLHNRQLTGTALTNDHALAQGWEHDLDICTTRDKEQQPFLDASILLFQDNVVTVGPR